MLYFFDVFLYDIIFYVVCFGVDEDVYNVYDVIEIVDCYLNVLMFFMEFGER